MRCDLLRIYYFCTINHSRLSTAQNCFGVVICFEFIIFALSITASRLRGTARSRLWFASNLLFLHYQSQLSHGVSYSESSCDLLRIYYFCTINHSGCLAEVYAFIVVICFEFIIFALSITATPTMWWLRSELWFASNLLFLHYQSQPKCRIPCRLCVVICFEFIIFALSITARMPSSLFG